MHGRRQLTQKSLNNTDFVTQANDQFSLLPYHLVTVSKFLCNLH